MIRHWAHDEKMYNTQRTEYVIYERDQNEPLMVLQSLAEARTYALNFYLNNRNVVLVSRTIKEELRSI